MKIYSINERMPYTASFRQVSSENDGKIRRFRLANLLFTVQLHSWEVEAFDKKSLDEREEEIRSKLPRKIRDGLSKPNHAYDSALLAQIRSETVELAKINNELLKKQQAAKLAAEEAEAAAKKAAKKAAKAAKKAAKKAAAEQAASTADAGTPADTASSTQPPADDPQKLITDIKVKIFDEREKLAEKRDERAKMKAARQATTDIDAEIAEIEKTIKDLREQLANARAVNTAA